MGDVTVIGLGQMGSTLARLLLNGKYRVTVWNRSAAKAERLVREGAVLAPSAAAAVAASPIVVICVHDYDAANEVLDTPEVHRALAGRTLLQLTTGSPQDARDSDAWARRHGAAYADGAIQAAPSQMGMPTTPILVSGSEAALRAVDAVLAVFGGNVIQLGDEPGAASAMDLATLSYVYGTVLGFIHGVRVAEAEGFRVDQYGSIVAGIASTFGAFLEHEAAMIQKDDYTVSESPLKISAEATERLARTARAAGINAEFPTFAADLFKRAMDAGYGDEEAAALIKVLRQSPSTA
jgi:3-hydroxyisobutyrate dehydrogenase-like beta-hydroxyacid dehydrogenase